MSRDPQVLMELYAGRALEPLDNRELEELGLLEASLGDQDDGSFDEAVAAVALASVVEYFEPMPESLRTSLASTSRETTTPARPEPLRAIRPMRVTAPRRRVSSGWWAAAACLVLAIFGWARGPQMTIEPRPVSARVARETLLGTAPAALQLAWTAAGDPLSGDATGDVVFDAQSQQGFMTFRDLPVNDPEEHQYQLWIFDGTRPDAHPVDGGVFDVTGDEAIVPIHAKLEVREPTLFAITLESPGGVVVSDREHLLLVAAVQP